MGYFYPSRLTVQAQGPKTVAAACGNWLMSHLVTALAQWQLPLGSWSQLEGWALQGRAVCPSSGVLRGQDGETEVQRGKGSSKGWLGEEGQLEGRPPGVAVNSPSHHTSTWVGCVGGKYRGSQNELHTAPSLPSAHLPGQGRAVRNTASPKL